MLPKLSHGGLDVALMTLFLECCIDNPVTICGHVFMVLQYVYLVFVAHHPLMPSSLARLL